MSTPTVSIHPYFKVHAGKLAEAKALLPVFVKKTATEKGCLFYEFTISDDVVFCREAYTDAAGVLAHLENVGPELDAMLKLSELLRLEFHGPAAELEKLREPLAAHNPTWFAYECGVVRD
jgi:quinol monooxygenase YgiN